ncbi:CDP-alcohol phosphatidyltransferase family protein [Halococcus agarilyticus]|uniref:CDP-alcohol phosphatidyltransferase family protein n=1 Tax=Halococcus agarilyticus TaxID=1232219 RepID=UPI0006776281|nr:CDP-alcohol phosphatidyltransferase family protein [Halococcus agarilyticus]
MSEAPHGGSLRLSLEVGGLVAIAGVLLVVSYPLIPAAVVVQSPLHPALVVGGLWTGQLWYLTRNLTANRSLGLGTRLRSLGVANAVTLLRGGLFAVVAGFVVVPPDTSLAWVPAACYGVGAALDRVDGLVARTVGRPTELGERLDMAFDTFGFVAAPVVAVLWGQLPVWYLSLSAARYVFRGAKYCRQRRGRTLFDRPDSDLGKYLAGVQMVFLTIALAPAIPTDLVVAVAPAVLAPSLAVFVRDYGYVAGWLPIDGRAGRN